MWGKILIPMYRLCLYGLYGLYGPQCLLFPERLLNLITHSLTSIVSDHFEINQFWFHWLQIILWLRHWLGIEMVIRHGHELLFNSLAPGRSEWDFKNVIFILALLIGIFKSSSDNILRWMPQDLTDDKSALVQVIAWCHQATSYYLNQSWPRSPTPYGVTRP